MKTDFIKPYPASKRLPATVAIHICGPTSLPAFHLPFGGESFKEDLEEVVWQLHSRLGVGRSILRELFEKLAELSRYECDRDNTCYCGSVFIANGLGRRFHISTLVPAEVVDVAKELTDEIRAYLEE